MKAIHVSEDIVPIGEFKAKASQFLRDIARTGQSLVITQNGRPAGVVISPGEFDRLQDRQQFLESIAAGLADADAGRMMTSAELRQRLSKRHAETPNDDRSLG
jgi:prevent-host-death family protein